MIITRTPYRVSFFGGKTDLPAWYRKHGGMVLSTTINKYCYISCRNLPPFFKHKIRLVYSKSEEVKNAREIKHPSIRECIKHLNIKEGLEIHHDGDIPAWSGMGTSSAFTVGLLKALHGIKGENISQHQLAKEAIHIEQNKIKEAVGSQDQIAAAFGGLNAIKFYPDDQFTVDPIILNQNRSKEFTSHLSLYFTDMSRKAFRIERDSIKNIPKKEDVLTEMTKMVPVAVDLVSNGKFEDFGKLLHESWQLKRSISDKISNSRIDEIYEAGKKAGALGGKILGAGGGGFILFVSRPENKVAIKKKLSKLVEVPFELENTGSQIIFYKPEIGSDNGSTFI